MQCFKKKRCFIGFGCFLFLIGASFFTIYLSPLKKEASPSYSYEIDRKSSSTVHLKENPFYEKQINNGEKSFPANAIHSYDISFIYNIHSLKSTKFQYKTYLKATLLGKVEANLQDEKEIWKRTFSLQEMASTTLYQKDLELKDQASIDYSYYKQLVKSFEKTYSISIIATLNIDFEIEWTDQERHKTYQDVISVTIPITDDVTSVLKDYKAHSRYGKIITKGRQQFFLIVGGIFSLFGLGFIFLPFILKKRQTHSKYKKRIRMIFREYKDLFIVLSKKPDVSALKMVALAKLDDLLHIAVQENKMILYYEELSHQESYFYVMIENYVYFYHLTLKEKEE